MSDIAIRVENLGKMYRIGRVQQRHDTLRDALAAGLSSLRAGAPSEEETIWALKDVSFEVKRGEVLGVIGRNGAGKSTLLRTLSRITEPTTGRAEIYGRVGSLLEVGTGFHPELSGRENIYLNGAILGMRRSEINRGFDEIVAFSEIDKFLDTPVKHYSSGMYVRLAFAVAAHLDPEILLIDEVLAVGDAAFQRKCVGKMEDISHEGKTVLFVSHNMAAVQSLCTRGLFLRQGAIAADGSVSDAVNAYLRSMEAAAELGLSPLKERGGLGGVRLTDVRICSDNRPAGFPLETGHSVAFSFQVSSPRPGLSCSFTIYDSHGQAIANMDSSRQSDADRRTDPKSGLFVCQVDELPLLPGRYRINVAIAADGVLEDHVEAAAFFDVQASLVNGRAVLASGSYGTVFIAHRWTTPGR